MIKSIKINGYEIFCDEKCGYGEIISVREISDYLEEELRDREWKVEEGIHICPNCKYIEE